VPELLANWGYRQVDIITWLKTNASADALRGAPAFYTFRYTEHCIVAVRGKPCQKSNLHLMPDVLMAPRRHVSQKPDSIYDSIEGLVPGGRFMEIFARSNNLRKGWISLGNQLTANCC